MAEAIADPSTIRGDRNSQANQQKKKLSAKEQAARTNRNRTLFLSAVAVAALGVPAIPVILAAGAGAAAPVVGAGLAASYAGVYLASRLPEANALKADGKKKTLKEKIGTLFSFQQPERLKDAKGRPKESKRSYVLRHAIHSFLKGMAIGVGSLVLFPFTTIKYGPQALQHFWWAAKDAAKLGTSLIARPLGLNKLDPLKEYSSTQRGPQKSYQPAPREHPSQEAHTQPSPSQEHQNARTQNTPSQPQPTATATQTAPAPQPTAHKAQSTAAPAAQAPDLHFTRQNAFLKFALDPATTVDVEEDFIPKNEGGPRHEKIISLERTIEIGGKEVRQTVNISYRNNTIKGSNYTVGKDGKPTTRTPPTVTFLENGKKTDRLSGHGISLSKNNALLKEMTSEKTYFEAKHKSAKEAQKSASKKQVLTFKAGGKNSPQIRLEIAGNGGKSRVARHMDAKGKILETVENLPHIQLRERAAKNFAQKSR